MADSRICFYCGERNDRSELVCKHCGKQLSGTGINYLAPELQIKEILSEKYEILDIIGKGGMATVYKARQKNLNRIVALKVVHPNLVHDSEFLARFHREAQMAASLNHPNIVMIHDVGSLNGIHFISMEYIDGEDLQSVIRKKGKLSVNDTVSIIAPIAEALYYAHQKGLVHRDVKSANIILTNTGRPVLTDFGIAHASAGTKLTMAGTVIGTPEYMSPEQAEGKSVDGRSDIFSLGIVMYECLTGNVPFKGNNPITTIHGIIYDEAPPVRKFNAKIPSWIADVINGVLAKKPEERVSSGLDLSVYLREKKAPTGLSRISLTSRKRLDKIINKSLQSERFLGNNSKILMGLIAVTSMIIITSVILYYRQRNKASENKSGEYISTLDVNGPSGDINGNNPEAIYNAEILFKEGRTDEALINLKNSLEKDPENIELKKKIVEIENIITNRNSTIAKLTTSGDNYFETGNFRSARMEYLKILKIDGKNQYALSRLRQIEENINLQKHAKNNADFEKFLALADSFYILDKYDKALIWYNKALNIKPDDGIIQTKLNDLKTRMNINKNEIDILRSKAQANLANGRVQEAENNLKEALLIDPNNQLVVNLLDSLKKTINSLIFKEINNTLIFIKGGTFILGSNISSDDQRPEHPVTVSSFYLDKYEVSVKQYKLFCEATGKSMPKEPPWGWNDNHPIVNISRADAISFASWAGKRLPTEAEWEYAALGGSESVGQNYRYSGSNTAKEVANFESSLINHPQPVGSNKPNSLGLYNMSGNVWELCSDFYDENYYKLKIGDNPKGPSNGKLYVIRGGAFNSSTREITVKNRAATTGSPAANIGFRCAKDY